MPHNPPQYEEYGIREKMTEAEAEAIFSTLPAVEVAELIGSWKGIGIETGHPFDYLLSVSGWRGKRFETADIGYPLVNNSILGTVYLNPGLLPFNLMVKLRIAFWPLMQPIIFLFNPLFATKKPRARLRAVRHQGVTSAAMVYDQLPIIDHFRRLDDTLLMGKMDQRGSDTCLYFMLQRDPG